MKNKFIFFGAKKSLIINILIIFQIALWCFYISSLFSVMYFNYSFPKKFEKSFKRNKLAQLQVNELVPDTNSKKDLYNSINKLVSSFEEDGYRCAMLSSSEEYPESFTVPLNVIKADKNDLNANFNVFDNTKTSLTPFYMDKNMVNLYLDNIDGNVNLDEWNTNNYIPVILGYNFSKKNKIGDKFFINNNSYKIIGFFKKDILCWSGEGMFNSSFSLNASFVIPIDEKIFLENYSCQPIVIYSNAKLDKNKLEKKIKSLYKKGNVFSITQDFDYYIKELKNKANFKIIRLLVTSIMITFSLILTLSYQIHVNKDRIGVLFAVGASKNKIFYILAYEFYMLVFLGVGIGSLIYLKKSKYIYIYNSGAFLSSIYMSILILIIFILCILRIGFNSLNRLTPKEMIGGFVE